MNAPIITSQDRARASWLIDNAPSDLSREAWDRALIAITGRPVGDWDARRPYSPADDYDFARDEYDDDPSGEMADRASDREHKWMGGER